MNTEKYVDFLYIRHFEEYEFIFLIQLRGIMYKSQQSNQISIKLNSQKGFSLIEVMVVIAIIGILSAAATVGFTEKIQKDRLIGAMAMTNEFLGETSMRVKKTNIDHSIKVFKDSIVIFEGIDCPANENKKVMTLPDQITFEGVSGVNSTGLPTGISAPTSNAYGSGWDSDCIDFLRNKIGNTVEEGGVLSLKHKNKTDLAGAVLKVDSDVRFRSYLYSNAKWSNK